ncbi:MAG: lysine--tRNA ligase, partial [Halobacteriales archaeon]
LPRKLADLDGNIVGLGDVDAGALGRNLGVPYTDIPDPFGCCDSYGDHFATLIEIGAQQLGIPVEMISTTDLYEDGAFDAITRHLLEERETARDVLAEYQDKVDASYIPFNPICETCGKITETVTSVDADADTVEYECTDIEAGGQTIEGCGHHGTASLRDGKLPWRFEWPAQWQALDVDHEPFGKDHAEGSWPSGTDIARNVMDFEPPVPMVYEWFTLNGEAFSSSEGNVILVQEVLEMLEPEVVRYFFTKDPVRARDFNIERFDQLTDEFDRFERHYYEEMDEPDPDTTGVAKAAYPAVIRPTVATRFDADGTPIEQPDAVAEPVTDPGRRDQLTAIIEENFSARERIPYTFAAVLGMTDDTDLRLTMAHRQEHLSPDAPAWVVTLATDRIEGARTWAERTDNEYNYRLQSELPAVEFDPAIEEALKELADLVADGADGETIQGEIYETAKRHDIEVGEFFSAGYRLFLGQEQGPRLGPFLAALDRAFVVDRLRRKG